MKTTYVIQEEFFAGKICRSNVSMCEVGKNKGAAFAKTYKASPLCWRQQISQNHFFLHKIQPVTMNYCEKKIRLAGIIRIFIFLIFWTYWINQKN